MENMKLSPENHEVLMEKHKSLGVVSRGPESPNKPAG
jgi:hypothetical protein